MKLSISNIAWVPEDDPEMINYIIESGWAGLEIAPTRIFPEKPYARTDAAKAWADGLKTIGLEISSMQSIWYGHTEKIFSSKEERLQLVDYTKQAILFAEIVGCKNLVFGNPKNRDTEDVALATPVAIDFFKEIGNFANEHQTVVALEPNPVIYNTRFMNTTEQTVEIAYKTNSDGIKVNVDLGAMIYNEEDVSFLKQIPEFINHVHISEPGLKRIERREPLHGELFSVLKKINYQHYVSVEMGNQNDIAVVKEVMNYINVLNNEV